MMIMQKLVSVTKLSEKTLLEDKDNEWAQEIVRECWLILKFYNVYFYFNIQGTTY